MWIALVTLYGHFVLNGRVYKFLHGKERKPQAWKHIKSTTSRQRSKRKERKGEKTDETGINKVLVHCFSPLFWHSRRIAVAFGDTHDCIRYQEASTGERTGRKQDLPQTSARGSFYPGIKEPRLVKTKVVQE